MDSSRTPPKVVVFCGGNGSRTIAPALVKYFDGGVTHIINAYDDGKSTGLLRKIFKTLGPSDFRKNHRSLISSEHAHYLSLCELWDYRFPAGTPRGTALDVLAALSKDAKDRFGLWQAIEVMDNDGSQLMREYLSIFLDALANHEQVSGDLLDFSDCALVNCMYIGAFLRHGRDLYLAIQNIEKILGLDTHVYPVSGHNRWLVSMKRDGMILPSEVETDGCALRDLIGLFALAERLSGAELAGLAKVPPNIRRAYVQQMSDFPKPDPLAHRGIAEADIIILSPGTLSTSLLPTYMASGLGGLVRTNKSALKILVTNISRQGGGDVESARAVMDATIQAFRHSDENPGEVKDYLNAVLINQPETEEPAGDYVVHARKDICDPGVEVVWRNFEDPKNRGIHNGPEIARTVVDLFN